MSATPLGERSEPNTQTIENDPQAISGVYTTPNLLNLHTSSPAVLSIDLAAANIVSAVSGITDHRIVCNELGDVYALTAVGALVDATYCAVMRPNQGKQPFKIFNWLRRRKTAALFWMIASALLLSFLFLRKITDTISRGALLLFFALSGAAIATIRVTERTA